MFCILLNKITAGGMKIVLTADGRSLSAFGLRLRVKQAGM